MLLVTLALFPFLYLTLELPKRIINDAIGAEQAMVTALGTDLPQTQYLGILCAAFLLAVLAHGILKMRINTMKGVLAERLLRRFRYQLVTRLFRFPRPFFQRTSQAEIVSMVTAESEPLGGMMGDAISQPVLQAGQMLTILGFLFLQSVWFGLAAVALIPLQAWLIPMLQRRINVLNKARIKEVRRLAAEIGETAAGASDLRTSGGHPFRAAQITDRLGKLFFIRLNIYRKKFFMKFLNNFITQLTPFFFFSVGGYLVIIGQVSLGALVAALAAYKDLSSPWKELLAYYNMSQEMSQRWSLITDHFDPAGTLAAELVDPDTTSETQLTGDIVLKAVRVRDADGTALLDGLDLQLPGGGLIGITSRNDEERQALAELLSRELMPTEGQISVGGMDLGAVHQATIGARIGVADAAPYLFEGTIGDNILMPLKSQPKQGDEGADGRTEANLTGNSADMLSDQWLSPGMAGLIDEADVERWWLTLMEGMSADQELITQGLALKLTQDDNPAVADAVVHLRDTLAARLDEDGLANTVFPFDVSTYNPALPLLDNILFAVARSEIEPAALAETREFRALLEELGLIDAIADLAKTVVDLLQTTFAEIGTDHPLFQRLSIKPVTFEASVRFNEHAKASGFSALKKEDQAVLLAMACVASPDQIGRIVPEELQDAAVAARAAAQGKLDTLYERLDRDRYAHGLTLLENAVFGAMNSAAGPRLDMLQAKVRVAVSEAGLAADVARLTLGVETRLGGSNLPARVRERIGFARAAIKKPDILILNNHLASYDEAARTASVAQLRADLPAATIIVLSQDLGEADGYDQVISLSQGKVGDGTTQAEMEPKPETTLSSDLASRVLALEQTVFFGGVDRKQLRLLAFSAQQFDLPAGQVVFNQGDDPFDGVYLVQKGEAEFFAPTEGGGERLIRTAGPGSLVGELALILGEPRTLTMRARTDISGLRIGGDEFITVLQNDAQTTYKLMQLIAGYLSKVPDQPS